MGRTRTFAANPERTSALPRARTASGRSAIGQIRSISYAPLSDAQSFGLTSRRGPEAHSPRSSTSNQQRLLLTMHEAIRRQREALGSGEGRGTGSLTTAILQEKNCINSTVENCACGSPACGRFAFQLSRSGARAPGLASVFVVHPRTACERLDSPTGGGESRSRDRSSEAGS